MSALGLAVVTVAPIVMVGVGIVAGRWSARRALTIARRAALVDPLTGLSNRAGLVADLARRTRGLRSFGVLLMDLDGFKAVNDTFGHAAGDVVLVEVGRRLSALVAGAGLVARLGGDEFVVLASSSTEVVSRLLAYDVVRVVSRPVDVGGCPITVGVSVGVVQATAGESPDRLLHAADAAMYRAKSVGGGVAEHQGALPIVEPVPLLRDRDLFAGLYRTSEKRVGTAA